MASGRWWSLTTASLVLIPENSSSPRYVFACMYNTLLMMELMMKDTENSHYGVCMYMTVLFSTGS